MVFISYWAGCYTTSDKQRFDNHCESHSALEVGYIAPIAIQYSVTGVLTMGVFGIVNIPQTLE